MDIPETFPDFGIEAQKPLSNALLTMFAKNKTFKNGSNKYKQIKTRIVGCSILIIN